VHISIGQYLAVAAIVAVGAFCQGTIGFGLNLIAAPIVGLVAPELLPATMVMVGTPLSISMALRGRSSIDWHGVGWSSLGRVPGTVAGVIVVSMVSVRALGGIVGGLVIVACVVASVHRRVSGREHSVNRGNAIGAGVASGFMDTAAATGGPPLALLYQHRPAAEVRSTLATSFALGTMLSITGLVIGGSVEAWQLLVALMLAPSLVIGLVASRLLATRLAGASLRPAILVFAALAGAAALTRALIG